MGRIRAGQVGLLSTLPRKVRNGHFLEISFRDKLQLMQIWDIFVSDYGYDVNGYFSDPSLRTPLFFKVI